MCTVGTLWSENVPISPATPADTYLVGLSPDSDNPGYINASYVDVSGWLGLRVVAEGGG